MQREMDRRVRRTRDLLHRSLVALILEKGYGRITVQDILDRADIGRSTFYAHYRTKDDLLLMSIMEHLRVMFAQGVATDANADAEPTPLLQPALALFQLADANRQVYRALVGRRGSDVARRFMHKLLSEVLTEHLRARLAVADESQLEATVAFLASGLIGLATWWLDSETPLSADEIYAYFEHLATQGIGAFPMPARATPRSRAGH